MFATCTEAVLLMNSSAAISPSDRPAASSAMTSRSRADRDATTRAGSSSALETIFARCRRTWNAITSLATACCEAWRRK